MRAMSLRTNDSADTKGLSKKRECKNAKIAIYKTSERYAFKKNIEVYMKKCESALKNFQKPFYK